jgi:cardiolipin synthase
MSLTIPNLLSLLRLGLVPFLVIAILDGQPLKALVIFVLAAITDGLDGYIARNYGQASVLGTFLDPISDKVLMITSYAILAVPGAGAGLVIPLWVTVLVIARDFIILLVALVLFLSLGIKSFPPILMGKITTVIQLVAIGLVLASRLEPRATVVAEVSVYLVAALTVISGLSYFYQVNRLVEERLRQPE